MRNEADPTTYVLALEKAFGDDINYHRFVPHLQLHEYEALLFADPDAFRIAFEDCDPQVERLKEIANSFQTVEHINDGIHTAPSKRIAEVIPAYEGLKAIAGPDIAELIGLDVIREKCAHFDKWIARLESLDWDD